MPRGKKNQQTKKGKVDAPSKQKDVEEQEEIKAPETVAVEESKLVDIDDNDNNTTSATTNSESSKSISSSITAVLTENPKAPLISLQDRLFNIRMKMNQGRKANKTEVEDEYKRISDPKYEARQRYLTKKNEAAVAAATAAAMGDAAAAVGVVAAGTEEDWMMQQTAAQAEQAAERAEQKAQNMATFGWQALTTDASHRAYEKRLKKLPTRSAAASGSSSGSGALTAAPSLPTTDAFAYGSADSAKVSASGLDRLSKDVGEREEARSKFSKRRLQSDSADVDYINDKNAAYNKKLKRAFDKYTVEIRQSLERGTAV